jgi:hypothetical protein
MQNLQNWTWGAGADSGSRISSGFFLFLSQNLAQSKFPEYTSVVRLSEFSKNHRVVCLEYWRKREPPVPIIISPFKFEEKKKKGGLEPRADQRLIRS